MLVRVTLASCISHQLSIVYQLIGFEHEQCELKWLRMRGWKGSVAKFFIALFAKSVDQIETKLDIETTYGT